MKYLVFSFDDGLLDFKTNALPILNKYKFKASINVVSGFSDKTVLTINKYLSVSDIVQLHGEGHEIASHTDTHKKFGSFDELQKCESKIKNWCKEEKIGIVMPKYSIPNSSSRKYIRQTNPPYITYTDKRINFVFNLLKTVFWKVKSSLKPNEFNKTMFLVNHCVYKKDKCRKFLRLSINNHTNPTILYRALKTMKDGCCLTICFHSITNKPFLDFFAEGSWSIHNFEELCNLISRDQSFRVVLQKEVCKKPN